MEIKTIVIDFNGTLELDGKLNTVLIRRLQEARDQVGNSGFALRILIFTGANPADVQDFLEKNHVAELFSTILTKPHMVQCDLYIDDDENLCKMMQGKYAAKSINAKSISLDSPATLMDISE